MTARPQSDVAWLLWQLLGNSGTLVDVGADIGTIALPRALAGTHVIAIEPLPRNSLKLHLACLLNRAANLKILQMAASSENGILHFGSEEAWGHVGGGQAEVMAIRLDTLMEMLQIGDPAFLCGPHDQD